MPASTAASILESRAGGGVAKARGMAPDDVIALVERSGLRGRGGAGHSLAEKMRAVRRAAERRGTERRGTERGAETVVVANAYDADPGSPLARTLIQRNLGNVLQGVAIAAHAVGAREAIVYMHPEATAERASFEEDIVVRREALDGLQVQVAVGPGGFMGGEESALLNVLESKRAMARQRPPYPAEQGYRMRPTLVSSAETLAWLPQIVADGVTADTKLVSVTGSVKKPGVYEVPLGTTLGAILDRAGGASGSLKAIHVGGPTGGILSAPRKDTKLDFDALRAAGTHMGSAQVRALTDEVCMVREAGKLFAYLAKESCAICVPCRVGTKRVQAILEGVTSSLGRDTDLPWLEELGDHMEKFSLCGFGITAPSIIRTTMREFPDDYRAHISEGRCPTNSCTPLRARRYETMVQP